MGFGRNRIYLLGIARKRVSELSFRCYANLFREIRSTSCAFAGAPLHSAQYDTAFYWQGNIALSILGGPTQDDINFIKFQNGCLLDAT